MGGGTQQVSCNQWPHQTLKKKNSMNNVGKGALTFYYYISHIHTSISISLVVIAYLHLLLFYVPILFATLEKWYASMPVDKKPKALSLFRTPSHNSSRTHFCRRLIVSSYFTVIWITHSSKGIAGLPEYLYLFSRWGCFMLRCFPMNCYTIMEPILAFCIPWYTAQPYSFPAWESAGHGTP